MRMRICFGICPKFVLNRNIYTWFYDTEMGRGQNLLIISQCLNLTALMNVTEFWLPQIPLETTKKFLVMDVKAGPIQTYQAQMVWSVHSLSLGMEFSERHSAMCRQEDGNNTYIVIQLGPDKTLVCRPKCHFISFPWISHHLQIEQNG